MMYKLIFLLLLAVLLTAPLAEAQEDETDFPLSAHGSYIAGKRTLNFTDEARAGRHISVTLWYPALVPADKLENVPRLQDANMALPDLPPDMAGAPYPVVVYSHGYRGGRDEFSAVLEPLVTHGFIVATIDHASDENAFTLIDRPLDIRFVLDQLERLNVGSAVAEMMALDRVGLLGNGDGGYTALAMTGARIDQTFMSQWGTGERNLLDYADPRYWFSDWDWNSLKAYYDQFMPPADGDFLQPLTDPRIDVIMANLPCHTSMFGEQGLGVATVPTLIIGGTDDLICTYHADAAFAHEHLGSPEHFMISFVGGTHCLLPLAEHAPALVHFTGAFFGYYLQDKTEYSQYLTDEFVSQFDQLAWGVYNG